MSPDGARTLLAVTTTGTGLVLLGRPTALGGGSSEITPPAAVVRLLGGRYAAQGLIQLANRGDRVLTASVVVDATHLLTMVVAAQRYPQFRRAATISGAVAAVAALAGTALLRR